MQQQQLQAEGWRQGSDAAHRLSRMSPLPSLGHPHDSTPGAHSAAYQPMQPQSSGQNGVHAHGLQPQGSNTLASLLASSQGRGSPAPQAQMPSLAPAAKMPSLQPAAQMPSLAPRQQQQHQQAHSLGWPPLANGHMHQPSPKIEFAAPGGMPGQPVPSRPFMGRPSTPASMGFHFASAPHRAPSPAGIAGTLDLGGYAAGLATSGSPGAHQQSHVHGQQAYAGQGGQQQMPARGAPGPAIDLSGASITARPMPQAERVPGAVSTPGGGRVLQSMAGSLAPPIAGRVLAAQALPGLVPGFDMDAAVQDQALQQMAHEFISGAVKLGCGVVRRRGSTQLEARDMIAYMEQNWQIRVPGFLTGETVQPAKRARKEPAPAEAAALTAVRAANAKPPAKT